MFDYNFFQENEAKKPKKPSMIIASIICITLILGMVGIVAWTYTQKSALQMNLNITKDRIREIQSNDDITRIMEKEELLVQLENIQQNIDAANQVILSENQVSENILALLSDNIPMDANLEKLEIIEGQMFIVGRADNRPAIAEFAHNLRLTDTIGDVFISSIEQDETEIHDYQFSMQAVIGGDTQ